MNKYLLFGIVAILVIAGGWWYFNQSAAVTSETTQQNQPATNAPVQTAQNSGIQKAAATIDQSSLTSNSKNPTISGTANTDIGIFIAKGKVSVTSPISTDWQNYAWRYWGHLGKCQSTTGDFCGFDILDGRWSIKVFGPGFELEKGVYTVIVTDSITGKDSANVLSTGILTVQ